MRRLVAFGLEFGRDYLPFYHPILAETLVHKIQKSRRGRNLTRGLTPRVLEAGGEAQTLTTSLEQQGFAVVANILSRSEVQFGIELLGSVAGAGRRGLLGIPSVSEFARSQRLLALVCPHVSGEPLPVRAIYFDK